MLDLNLKEKPDSSGVKLFVKRFLSLFLFPFFDISICGKMTNNLIFRIGKTFSDKTLN